MSFESKFDELHDIASAATRLSDFGPTDYVAPMRLMLADYSKIKNLPAPAVQMMTGDIVGQLVGRLMAVAGFKSHPAASGASIERPIFVVGMARTGTTALHRLLAADPEAQAMPFWLACAPAPRPPRDTWASNPWYQAALAGLEDFYRAAPEFKSVHPIIAGEPDECRIVLGQTFWSPSMASVATTSDYADWCLSTNARPAYEYHRRVLDLIAAGDRRRWVLKCPTHTWGLDALLDVYPDACVIFTHRDITAAMASTASMVHLVRRSRDPAARPEDSGTDIVHHYGRALDKCERVRARHDPKRFFDLHVSQTRNDPVATIGAIYRHFDIPFSTAAECAIRAASAKDPSMGHGQHDFTPEYFGLSRARVLAATGAYAQRNQELEAQFSG